MGSRIKPNPSLLLECWCEVGAGHGPDQPPWIMHKFPNTFDNQQTLSSIPQFVFPCRVQTTVVQMFSFVLTALDSTFTFGFCRHSPNSESAMVVLSHLPWDSTFYKILNQCSELQSSDSPSDIWSFLKVLYQTPVPEPGSELTVSYSPTNRIFVTKCPNHLSLPSLPDNRNLMEYLSAVDTDTMMLIFASMLFERRIIVSSRHLHRLSACVQAANALLYPMTWQHIYIPIMPEPLLDYLLAPMPYLIGVPDILMKKVRLDEVGEVVYLNADTNVVETPFNDLAELPSEVSSSLKRRLNRPGQGMGDSVPRAFLRALVMLIGNYREALQLKEDDRKVFFNEEKFIASRPHHIKLFVEKMLELQIFRQFLEERLDLVNRGEATSDEFEMEVSVYSDKPRKNFQQLLLNVRREGGDIVRHIRDKTNPAVKLAVKSVSKSGKQVKEKGQEKYKEIRGKMKLPSTRSPEHSTWESDQRSAPSSPISPPKKQLNSNNNNNRGATVTAKATYKRPVSTPHRQRGGARESVPASISSSSFQSPDSPGHTPAPHTIDLVGELEQELITRLSEPHSNSIISPPSRPMTSYTPFSSTQPQVAAGNAKGAQSSSSRGPIIPRPTVLPPPVPSARANTTLVTSRGQESSPSKQTLTTANKAWLIGLDCWHTESMFDGHLYLTEQDLIILDNPQEEDFDPLITKSIPTKPVPTPRASSSFSTLNTNAKPPDPFSAKPTNDTSETISPPPRRPTAPHPVPSFLHSHSHRYASDQRFGLTNSSSSATSSNTSSSSSLGSIYQPYLPFSNSSSTATYDSKTPPVSSSLLPSSLGVTSVSTSSNIITTSGIDTAVNIATPEDIIIRSGEPLGIASAPSRHKSVINPSTVVCGSSNTSTSSAPAIPVPARRTTSSSSIMTTSSGSSYMPVYQQKIGGGSSSSVIPAGGVFATRPATTINTSSADSNSIPSSAVSGLPAALQHHLANKKILNRNISPVHQHQSTSPSSQQQYRHSSVTTSGPFQNSLNLEFQSPDTNSRLQLNSKKQKSNSVFNDPRYVPFSNLQSTSTTPPTMQSNPLYNAHSILNPVAAVPSGSPQQVNSFSRNPNPSLHNPSSSSSNSIFSSSHTPNPSSYNHSSSSSRNPNSDLSTHKSTSQISANKPNLAAAFANTMLGDEKSAANNNTIDSKMLLSDFSDQFDSMSVNKSADASAGESEEHLAPRKQSDVKSWTSFE